MNVMSKMLDVLWGPPMLVLLFGTGVFLSLGLRFMPWRKLVYALGHIWRGRRPGTAEQGEISPFNALMTALAATIGTGNIAGVATAIFSGGPGALFWMWLTAMVGMATKFAECALAVKYRETAPDGSYVGGPMYYIKNGLGRKFMFLAWAFAFFGAVAGFGIGNTVQVNSIAEALGKAFNIPLWITAVLVAVLAGLVIIGGVRRIGQVAGRLVPFMAFFYFVASLIILIINAKAVPGVLVMVFEHAFTGSAAAGGFMGASVMMAIRYGVARGVFSNEAGMGSAPIAHASAQTKSPVRQGLIGMTGTFLDTIVVCSCTGLCILVTGAWTGGLEGAAMTTDAFERVLPGVGGALVAVSLTLFAFTTILGWSVYSERCFRFLLGHRVVRPFRLLFILVMPVGALMKLDVVWNLADIFNALMAIPNLIALLLLSPVVFRLARDYFADRRLEARERTAKPLEPARD